MSTISSAVLPRGPGKPRRLMVDSLLILATMALLLIGCVMVTSASISVASKSGGNPFYFLERQLLAVGLGAIACMIAVNVPTAFWEKLNRPLLVTAFALLVLVLIPGIGHRVNGSQRWVRLGLMNFQVSEVVRVFVLMYVASYVAQHQAELKQEFRSVFQPLAILGLATVLLLLEPDFGAAAVLLVAGVALLFLGGMKWRHLLPLIVGGVAVMALIAVAAPYRMKRLVGCIDPWADPFDSCYQLTQSLIAIGRGEWFGVGLGSSVQKLFYLPEAHTDFVFAVLAEEFGLLGVLVTMLLFAVAVLRSLRIARMAAEAGMAFQAFVAASFGIWMGLQSLFNIGINMGSLPTKGLTLPLLSYGGSSILVSLAWLGIVLRIHHEASMSGRSALPRKERAA